MAKAYEEFIEIVKYTKEGHETANGMNEDTHNANLLLALGALKVTQSPEMAAVVTAAEFGEGLAYLGYVSIQVDDLARITDSKLTLTNRIARLKRDVHAFNTVQKDWAASGKYGCAGLRPVMPGRSKRKVNVI